MDTAARVAVQIIPSTTETAKSPLATVAGAVHTAEALRLAFYPLSFATSASHIASKNVRRCEGDAREEDTRIN